jgi:hypothetical protein
VDQRPRRGRRSVVTAGSGSVQVATTGSLGTPGTITVSASSPAPIELSGAPTYLKVPAGDAISVGPAESFGPDLALASAGATATASSSQGGDNRARDVIRGTADAENGQGINSTPAWASKQGDASPWIQVNLPRAESIDRVIVSTSSLGSVLPGLRDYSVNLYANGTSSAVANVSNEFFARMEEVGFPAVSDVRAVKISVSALDLNSELGGLPQTSGDRNSPATPSYTRWKRTLLELQWGGHARSPDPTGIVTWRGAGLFSSAHIYRCSRRAPGNSRGRLRPALRAGGHLDTLVECVTGVFFFRVEPEALRRGVARGLSER